MPRMKESPRMPRPRGRANGYGFEPASLTTTSIGGRLDACAFIATELAKCSRYVNTRPRRTREDVSACLELLQKGFATIAAHLSAIRPYLPARQFRTDCPTPVSTTRAGARTAGRETHRRSA